jgi:hypothetical protein
MKDLSKLSTLAGVDQSESLDEDIPTFGYKVVRIVELDQMLTLRASAPFLII